MQCADNQSGNQEYLREILKASHRAKDLVNQILTFSRQTEQEGTPIQMSTIIKEVTKQFQATLPKTITARTVFRSENDVVAASPTQLHQIMMNLCTNAIHAMRETGGTLEIATANFVHRRREKSGYPALESGRYLRVSVRDTGIGMNEATMERIFEPFFTTKASGEGTGMGLAVVHGIVSSLKGSISVESKPGEGSAFHVVLPVVERARIEEKEDTTPLPTGHETILFVDDEKDIVKMQAHMLSSLGYRPVLANSGEEALRLFRMNPDRYGAVITDQVMPGMVGTELAKALLAIRPDVPIILCTGFSESVTPEQVRELGIKEFMLKPIVMRQLAEALRRVLAPVAAAEDDRLLLTVPSRN
jgi:CheY-like chemotaxis protein